MGQKVNPKGFRVGYNKQWLSTWVAKQNGDDFAIKTAEDENIRRLIYKELKNASISDIEIIRTGEKCTIIIYTAKPGMVIGKKGSSLDALRKKLVKRVISKYTKSSIQLKIKEIKNKFLDAALIGQEIARQVEGRGNYKRAIKKAIGSTMQSGARGVKVRVAGRLNGAEMARNEMFTEGQIPLSTLRENIDYKLTEANTKFGIIGIKVWLLK